MPPKRELEETVPPSDSEDAASTPETQKFKVQTDDEGNKYIELSEYRRVTVRQWKGKTYVDIREFYTDKKTNKKMPGKKGISMDVALWNTLMGLQDTIGELVDSLESAEPETKKAKKE